MRETHPDKSTLSSVHYEATKEDQEDKEDKEGKDGKISISMQNKF